MCLFVCLFVCLFTCLLTCLLVFMMGVKILPYPELNRIGTQKQDSITKISESILVHAQASGLEDCPK